MRARCSSWLLVAATLGLAGCLAPTESWSLANRKIRSLDLRLARSQALCPGFADELVITAIDADGQRHASSGAGGGPIGWGNFDVEMTGGSVSTAGRVRVVADPLATSGRPPVVKVTSVHYPAATAKLVIPIRYDCEYMAHFGGRPGTPGRPGKPGTPGNASVAPGNGSAAAAGKPGGRGLEITATLSLVELDDGSKVLRAVLRARNGRRQGTFFLDPAKGRLRVNVTGGRGGRGGLGGPGGAAAPAAAGAKARGGDGGAGGRGGPGGDGGAVKLTVDPAAKAYETRLTFDVSGGKGGQGGPGGNGGRGAAGGAAGESGPSGDPGKPGPEPEVVYEEVFEI